jgi:hypothetical protein
VYDEVAVGREGDCVCMYGCVDVWREGAGLLGLKMDWGLNLKKSAVVE